jgi:PAS domain S-box-containing protein
MDVPLNVLILEDCYADAALMAEELRKSGFAPEWRRADTERDYLAALDPGLDVILADHRLPQYDSIQALQQLQERGLDVPFIVVSGAINEELAVSLLKRGAADYILKDRLARLGQAVVQAVEQRKLRQERRRLEEQLVLFRTLLDRTNDIIEIVDAETGQFLDVNEAACAAHGYTREEFLRLNVLDVEETLTEWPPPDATDKQRKAGFVVIEGLHCRKDGSTFPVEVYVNFVHLDRDYSVAVVRDISERKRAEATTRAAQPVPQGAAK